jgi:hypothetical protein
MVRNPELLALRRQLRELLAAWRRTRDWDRDLLRYCHPGETAAYYRGCVDGTASCIRGLNLVMFPTLSGAPKRVGAPSFSRRSP